MIPTASAGSDDEHSPYRDLRAGLKHLLASSDPGRGRECAARPHLARCCQPEPVRPCAASSRAQPAEHSSGPGDASAATRLQTPQGSGLMLAWSDPAGAAPPCACSTIMTFITAGGAAGGWASKTCIAAVLRTMPRRLHPVQQSPQALPHPRDLPPAARNDRYGPRRSAEPQTGCMIDLRRFDGVPVGVPAVLLSLWRCRLS
jgi:hypothetical protein